MGAKCRHAYRQCYARVGSPQEAVVLCEQSAALRSSAAGSFRVFAPLPPQAPSEEQSPSTPRYAYGVFIPACYSSTPLPGRIPPEVFRAGRGQPFRLLAQTLSVCSADKPPPKLPKTAPGGHCQGFAHQRRAAIRAGEPSRLRPRRPSASPTSCRSLSAAGSLRSPVRGPAKARQRPTPSRPPPGPRSTSFRALWHWQTHSRRTRPPPQPSRLRDCQHHRPPRNSRLGAGEKSTDITRPDGREGVNIYATGSSGSRRCGCLDYGCLYLVDTYLLLPW